MQKEPNLIRVEGEVVIIGDIHGQYYDLIEILRKVKFGKTRKKLVFMGDYVDRGNHQIEVVSLLFGMKVAFPNQIYLLRGNHETRNCTERYDFRKHVIRDYDQLCYDAVMDMFDQLPLSAAVNGQYLALHGGISDKFQSFKQLNEINRV